MKRYIITALIALLLAAIVSISQVSVSPKAFASLPAAGLGGRVLFTSDSWLMAQDTGTGGTFNYYGNLRVFVPPPAIGTWTEVNKGTSSITDAYGGITIIPQAEASKNRIIARALPATPYTVTVRFAQMSHSGTNGFVCGAGWWESGTNKAQTMAAFTLAGNTPLVAIKGAYVVDYFTNLSTAAAGGDIWVQNSPSAFEKEQAFQLFDDGTNIKTRISFDGGSWQETSNTLRTANFTTAPDRLVFYVGQYDTAGVAGTPVSGCVLKSWQVQ